MCFLSVYRLKYFISIGIVVTLLIGISLLYVLVYSFIISSVTIQVQTSFRTILLSIFLSTSLLMILSSLSGIYGTSALYIGLVRKKNKFVVFYAVTMGIYMLSFLTLGIGTSVTPQFITQQCNGPPSQNSYETTIAAGNQLLCKSNCPCYYTNSQGYSTQQLSQMGIITYRNDSTLPINAQGCSSWNMTTYPLTNQMAWLQMFFNCSGWCTLNSNPPFYVFSNINYGVPNGGPCAESVSTFFYTFGRIIMIASFTVSSFILIVLVIICCLCLHPDRGLKYDSLELFKKSLIFISEGTSQKTELQYER